MKSLSFLIYSAICLFITLAFLGILELGQREIIGILVWLAVAGGVRGPD